MTAAFRRVINILIVACLAAGCARIDSPTFRKYYQDGMVAERNNDYAAARENYYRALVNARVAQLGPKDTAAAVYSYGRMVGVYCDFALSEKLLLEAKRLEEETKGPVHRPLLELARLKLDEGDYAASAKYFAETLALVDRKDLIEADPIGYAEMFEEYANVLRKLDRTSEAAAFASRAEALRKAYPGRKAVAEPTPYGRECPKGGSGQ